MFGSIEIYFNELARLRAEQNKNHEESNKKYYDTWSMISILKSKNLIMGELSSISSSKELAMILIENVPISLETSSSFLFICFENA